MPLLSREQIEAWAIHLVANGHGVWPLPPENVLAREGYDNVAVSFTLEDSTVVNVYVRKGEETIHEFNYELRKR